MSDASEIEHLLDTADHLPWGPEERELVARAVELARASGDETLEYRARMRQTASANMGGDTELTLASFAWCLAHHDADPARFPAEIDGNDLMWHFKWMAGNLRCSPAFDESQIDAVLDDMEEHYRRAGLGMSGVHMARFESAWSRGRLADAERERELLEATPRDSHSHCDACVRSQLAGFFLETGREDDAIRLVDEMVANDYACAEEPEHALARVMLPLARAGREDDARAAHLRSYRLARSEPDHLSIIALHLEFLAVTGNEARALALVERHIGWLAHDGLNDDAHCAALAAIAVALDAVTDAGHGDAIVRGADDAPLERFLGSHDGVWRARELADAARRSAQDIAARFDVRNGNHAHSERVAAVLALRDQLIDLSVSGEQFVPETEAAPTTTAEERWRRALDLADWGDARGALVAARAALADADTDAARAARLHGMIVGAHAAIEDWDAAATALPARIAALRAEGQPVLADLEERLGLALYGRTAPGDVEGLVAALDRTDIPAIGRADLELALASARVDGGDLPAAIEHAESALAAFGDAGLLDRAVATRTVIASLRAATGDPGALDDVELALNDDEATSGSRARLLDLRARLSGARDDYDSAAEDADEACRLVATIGVTHDLTGVHSLAAMLHHDAGDVVEAVLRYRVAVAIAEREQSPQLLTLRYQLGISLLASGQAAESCDILTDVLVGEQEADVPADSRAQTAGALAQAFEAADRPGEAVQAWSLTAELFSFAGDDIMQAHAHLHAGRILGRFGEHDDALEELEHAVRIARTHPSERELLARALHLLGQAAGNAMREEASAHLDEAAAIAAGEDLPWLVADITDSRGRVMCQRGDIDAGVALLLQAADLFVAAGDADAAASAELFASRVLMSEGRGADSVPLFRAAIEHTTDSAGLRSVAAIELGDVLDSLGRHLEATEIRRLIEG